MIAIYDFAPYYCPNCGERTQLDLLSKAMLDALQRSEPTEAPESYPEDDRCRHCGLDFHSIETDHLISTEMRRAIEARVHSECARALRKRADVLGRLGVSLVQIVTECRHLANEWHGGRIRWCAVCGTYTDCRHQPDLICHPIGKPEFLH